MMVLGGLAALVGTGLLVWLIASSSGENRARTNVEVAPVTAMDLREREAVASPVVARDPTTAEFVAAATRRDAPAPGCGLQVSGTGGSSWRPVDAVGELPEGVDACHMPQVGFDDEGRLVYSFVAISGSERPRQPVGLFAVTSDDHAQTFSQPRRLTEVDTFASSVAVGPDGIHAAWLADAQGGPSDQNRLAWPVGSRVLVAGGDATGLDEPVTVSDSGGLVAAPTVVSDSEGGAVLAYYQLPTEASPEDGAASLVSRGPWQLMVARRPGDGEGFGKPVAVAKFALPEQPDVASGETPSLARPLLVSRLGVAAPGLGVSADRVCASWTDAVEGQLEALIACSTDGGDSWGQLEPLGATLPEETSQWLPQVALTPGGRIEAVFYSGWDQAQDRAVDVFYAAAASPTTGFDSLVQVTSQSSHPQVAPLPGWFGTRLGLASGPDTLLAAWADSRNGLSIYPSQTIFAATIDAPGRRGGPAGWVAGGLLVGGLLVAATGLFLSRRAHPTRSPGPADDADVAERAGTKG